MVPCRRGKAERDESGTRAFFRPAEDALPNAGWGPSVTLRADGEGGKIMRCCDVMKKHEKFFLMKRDGAVLRKGHDSSVCCSGHVCCLKFYCHID